MSHRLSATSYFPIFFVYKHTTKLQPIGQGYVGFKVLVKHTHGKRVSILFAESRIKMCIIFMIPREKIINK